MFRRHRLLTSQIVHALILLLLFGTFPASAFHFPWDQGHDTFTPNPGDNDTDPGDEDCNNTGSPFELSTGNFIYKLDVLLVPGIGPDIDVVLTYNSRDMRSGFFGHGWSFSYDQRMVEVTDGVTTSAICRQGSGKREKFTKAADGSFTSPSDVFARLTSSTSSGSGYTLREKDGLQRIFDSAGRLATLVDRNGNTLSFDYDATGFLTGMTDASNRTVTFTKGADGKVASLTDPAGNVYRFTYDAAGNLTTFTNPQQETTRYSYDTKHNLLEVIDPRGNIEHKNTYDSSNRVATYREGGETWTVAYFTGRTTKRDSQSRTWTYFYNANGNVTQTVDPLGKTEIYEYGSNFYVSKVVDKNGRATSFAYDGQGNTLSITDPAGQITSYTYDPLFNLPLTETNPAGGVASYAYDSRGNLTGITDYLGGTTALTYDARGLVTKVTDAQGGETLLTWDANGNVAETRDPLGRTVRATYDVIGNPTSVTDPEGRPASYEYDGVGRLVREVDALGGATSYTYDANDNLVALTDPAGNTTSFEYDALSRLSRVTDPGSRILTRTYDSKGNLTSTTDAKGQTITFTYDAVGRLIRKNLPGEVVTLTYDNTGNITSIVDGDSSLTYVYDAMNRLASASTGATVSQPATTISYTYDSRGNRSTMTDPQGGVTSYTYDAGNRLVSLANPQGEATAYAYDDLSRRVGRTFDNGVATSYAYDSSSRLTSLVNQIGSSVLSRFDYTYDAADNRITQSDLDGTHSYAYDGLNRIVSASHPQAGNPSEQYTYDAAGNRRSSHLSANYAYAAGNRLVSDDAFDYVYDANGNLTQKTSKANGEVTRYTYDAFNQLVRVDLPGGGFATYRYDGLGRRIEKNVNGAIRRYIHDGEHILLELDGTNAVVARYTYGPGVDDPVSMTRGGASYFYTGDGVGSVRELTDESGAVAATYLYDSFGNLVAQTGTIENPFTFTGRERDAESGLYHYRARYYDPATGRFVSEDPTGFAGGLNPYVYVKNNPLVMVDPSGEFLQFIIGAGTSVLTGFIIAKITGSCYGWKDALIDAGTGALGVGLASKAQKLLRLRKLRNLAKSKGLTNMGQKGYTETWQNATNSMERLLIKFEAGKSPGLAAGSKQPRFSWRTGPGQFWDPFTGATGPGPKSALGHIPLYPPMPPGVSGGVGAGTGAIGGGARAAGNSECECE